MYHAIRIHFFLSKSFDSDQDYKEYLKSFQTADKEEIKMMRSIKAGITDVQDGHYHTVEMDDQGNGLLHTHLICPTTLIKL